MWNCVCALPTTEGTHARSAPLAITGTPRVSSWADVSPASAMGIQTAAFLALALVWAASTTQKGTSVSAAGLASSAVIPVNLHLPV